MATLTETLRFRIEADLAKARSELQGFAGDLRKTDETLRKTGSGAGLAFTALGQAFAGTQILRGINSTIQSAGQLTNVIATAEQVFGDAYEVIDRFSDSAVEAVGLSKQAATAATTFLGGLGKAAGLAGEDLANFSIALTGLGADLAAAFNTSVEDAVKAIQSGFSGSSIEPLREYNVVINDTILKQEYFALTGEKVAGTLSTQQRMLAFISVLQKQTADYQGQWARESDQLLGTQQRLNAEFENFQANLAQGVVPAFTSLLSVGNSVLQFFNQLPYGVQAFAGQLTSTVAVFTALRLGVAGAGNAMESMGVSTKRIGAITSAANKGVGALSVGLFGLQIAAEEAAKAQRAFANESDEIIDTTSARQRVQEFSDLLTKDFRGAGQKVAGFFTAAFEEAFGDEKFSGNPWNRVYDRDAEDTFDKLVEDNTRAAYALLASASASAEAKSELAGYGLTVDYMTQALEAWRQEQLANGAAEDELNAFVEDGIVAAEGLTDQYVDLATATENLGKRLGEMASALDDVRQEAQDSQDALEAFMDAARGEVDTAFDPIIARLEAIAAIEAEAAALAALDEARAKGEGVREAELDYYQSRQDSYTGVADLVEAEVRGYEDLNNVQLTAQQRFQMTQLIIADLIRQYPELADGLRAYYDELRQDPPEVVFGTDAQQVTETIDRIQSAVDEGFVIETLVTAGIDGKTAQQVFDLIGSDRAKQVVVEAVTEAAEADIEVLSDEERLAEITAKALTDEAESTLDAFLDDPRSLTVYADTTAAMTALAILRAREAATPIRVPVVLGGVQRPSGGGTSGGSGPGRSAFAEAAPIGFSNGVPMAVAAFRPAASNTYVTVNLPPASEPDAVVGAIQQWARRNGSIFAPVD